MSFQNEVLASALDDSFLELMQETSIAERGNTPLEAHALTCRGDVSLMQYVGV